MQPIRGRDHPIEETQENLEGLGPIPRNLDSVGNILLFNTTKNPYDRYALMDPLLGVVTGSQSQVVEKRGMFAAPKSIVKGEHYLMVQVSHMAVSIFISECIGRRASRTATCLALAMCPNSKCRQSSPSLVVLPTSPSIRRTE
jgi:hypothetical protein